MWVLSRLVPVLLWALALPAALPAVSSGQGLGEVGSLKGPGTHLLPAGMVPRTLSLGRDLPPPSGPDDRRFFVTSQGRLLRALEPDTPPAASPPQSFQSQIPGPGRAFLYSALLPGLGQRVMGQDRWILYLAGEAWAWIQFFERRREGRALQREYRELAWLVARRVSSGRRVDGDFEYYEAMTQFRSSGAYDADPGVTGVQPEQDPETFNGSIWTLARQIFFLDDPEQPVTEDSDQYEDALRYYRSRAYTQNFAWSWGSSPLQQDEFTALIRASDENLRRSTTMVGVILANHLLSAVDALVSGRLGQVERSGPRVQLQLSPGPFRQDRYLLTVRIPLD